MTPSPDRVPSRRPSTGAVLLVGVALAPTGLRAVEVQTDPGPGGDAYKSTAGTAMNVTTLTAGVTSKTRFVHRHSL